jgi:hypothetical protein
MQFTRNGVAGADGRFLGNLYLAHYRDGLLVQGH